MHAGTNAFTETLTTLSASCKETTFVQSVFKVFSLWIVSVKHLSLFGKRLFPKHFHPSLNCCSPAILTPVPHWFKNHVNTDKTHPQPVPWLPTDAFNPLPCFSVSGSRPRSPCVWFGAVGSRGGEKKKTGEKRGRSIIKWMAEQALCAVDTAWRTEAADSVLPLTASQLQHWHALSEERQGKLRDAWIAK